MNLLTLINSHIDYYGYKLSHLNFDYPKPHSSRVIIKETYEDQLILGTAVDIACDYYIETGNRLDVIRLFNFLRYIIEDGFDLFDNLEEKRL